MGLALSVFFWGLGYKLSLYNVHRLNSHTIPRASLLSRNEDPAVKDTAFLRGSAFANDPDGLAIVALSTTLLFSLFLLEITLQSLTGLRQPEVSRFWHIRFCASLTTFFFRPPPAFFLL